jgi:hypothetical protein
MQQTLLRFDLLVGDIFQDQVNGHCEQLTFNYEMQRKALLQSD